MLNLFCRPITLTKGEDDNLTRITLRTERFETKDVGYPIPHNVTLEFSGDSLSDAVTVKIVLGEQPTLTFKADTSAPTGEPLHEDEKTVEHRGVTIKLKRQKHLPNPNCYEVFYGKTNVGYIRLPFHSLLWSGKFTMTGVGELDKFTAPTFDEAGLKFCDSISRIFTKA